MIAFAIRGFCGTLLVCAVVAAGQGCASFRSAGGTKGPDVIRLEKLRDLDLSETAGSRGYLSAASDLVLDGEAAYVVADDELILGIFDRGGSKPGRGMKLFSGSLPDRPDARKAAKPDLEACVLLADGPERTLLMVPSGSTPQRRRGARLALPAEKGQLPKPVPVDFSEAFAKISESVHGLNIEGAASTESELIFLHRGNEAASRNAVIRLDRKRALSDLRAGKLSASAIHSVREIDLGEHAGTRLSFTSATYDSRGRLWYLAVAEGGGSSYLDGEFTAAVLGRLSPNLTSVEGSHALSIGAKPEGLAFDPADPTRFYVVTDSDDPASKAGLYSGRLE